MRNLLRILERYPISTFVYALASAGFLCFALWDVHNIITDFLTDNRVTLVKIKDIQELNVSLFGKLGIHLYFDHSIFPMELGNFKSISEKFVSDEKQMNRSMTLLFMTHLLIRRLDIIGPQEFRSLLDNLPGKDLNHSTLSGVIREFLENPASSDEIQNSWAQWEPMFIRNSMHPPHSTLGGIWVTTNYIFFELEVPVRETHIPVHLEPDEFELDFLRGNWNDSKILSPNSIRVTYKLDYSFNQFETVKDPEEFMNFMITIKDIKLVDKSRSEQCSYHLSRDDCWMEIRWAIFEDVCNCIPYMAYISQRMRKKGKKLCTLEIYEKCWFKANQTYYEAKKKDLCSLCYYVTNYPPISHVGIKWAGYANGPGMKLGVHLADAVFHHYIEKPQFTGSQLMGQIGGDLGLYIGFSMISLVNGLMALCRWLKKFRAIRDTEKGKKYWQRLIKSLEKRSSQDSAVQTEFTEIDEDGDGEELCDMGTEQVMKRQRKLEIKVDGIMKSKRMVIRRKYRGRIKKIRANQSTS